MCPVELVEQTTWVTQRRLTVRTFAPENSRVGATVGAGEISICCYWTSTEGLCEMHIAWFAWLFGPDHPSFSFRFSEVAVGFVVQTTCVAVICIVSVWDFTPKRGFVDSTMITFDSLVLFRDAVGLLGKRGRRREIIDRLL